MKKSLVRNRSLGSVLNLALFVFAAMVPRAAMADGPGPSTTSELGREAYVEPQPEDGSAASFDKRLPPVIPGEEIKDGKKTIKVWTTAGPVSAGPPPEPPQPFIDPESELDQIDVIVDRDHHSRGGSHRGSGHGSHRR